MPGARVKVRPFCRGIPQMRDVSGQKGKETFMDIASAKQQIRETIQIYLAKDEAGHYRIPLTHQRPVFLIGAPGLGKTAIVHQISSELKIGMVAYSMTHHTRQSAVGLPVIVQKEYDGVSYAVSEYTMSEIIASVYDCMEKTGCREGILFLDEINCISETLLPPMLLFLQYKMFGGHRLPEGWVVVSAGNPKKYNRNAREFEVAIIDRLLYMEVEPDYPVWKRYALEKKVSGAVLGYLESHREHFSVIEKNAEYTAVVTPRGWEDLSENLRMREELGLTVDGNVISQYLQHPEIMREFAAYYRFYQRFKGRLDVTAILDGVCTEETLAAARAADPCERIALTGMITEALTGRMGEVMAHMEKLRQSKNRLQETSPDGGIPEDEKQRYQKRLAGLKEEQRRTQDALGAALRFLTEAFGEGNELGIAVSDLAMAPQSAAYLGQFPHQTWMRAAASGSLPAREEKLLERIAANRKQKSGGDETND